MRFVLSFWMRLHPNGYAYFLFLALANARATYELSFLHTARSEISFAVASPSARRVETAHRAYRLFGVMLIPAGRQASLHKTPLCGVAPAPRKPRNFACGSRRSFADLLPRKAAVISLLRGEALQSCVTAAGARRATTHRGYCDSAICPHRECRGTVLASVWLFAPPAAWGAPHVCGRQSRH